MIRNLIGRPRKSSLLWNALALVAAVGLGVGLWLASGDNSRLWLELTVPAVTAVLGAAWLWRARDSRRLQAFFDTYANREIARQRRRQVLKRLRTHSVI